MKQKLYAILVIAIAIGSLMATSCKKQDMETNNPYSQDVKSAIPYADSLELQEFTNDAQIVNYQLARKLALIQLHSSNKIETLKWESYKLSERPVIVYGFDNKPMYYDFFMCDANNTEKATITVNARKSASVIIKKYGNFVESYKAITKGGGERLYADLSGTRYRAAGTKSGNVSSAVNINSGEVVNNLKQMSDDEIMLMMEAELLPQMYQDPELLAHHKSEMRKRLADHKAKSQAMWDFVAVNQTFVDTVSDHGISTMRIPGDGNEMMRPDGSGDGGGGGGDKPEPPKEPSNVGYSDDREQAYLISFENKYQTKWRECYCGPWIATYILESKYGGYINPTVFYHPGYIQTWGDFQGAMTAECLNNALKDYSNEAINVDLRGTTEWDIYWYIRQNALCSARLTIAWQGKETQYHWTCIYGATRDIFWNGNTNYYFLQADNGALIRTPWNNSYRDPKDQYSYEALVWCDTKFKINMY